MAEKALLWLRYRCDHLVQCQGSRFEELFRAVRYSCPECEKSAAHRFEVAKHAGVAGQIGSRSRQGIETGTCVACGEPAIKRVTTPSGQAAEWCGRIGCKLRIKRKS